MLAPSACSAGVSGGFPLQMGHSFPVCIIPSWPIPILVSSKGICHFQVQHKLIKMSGARMELGDKELSAEKGKARVEAPWASEERALEERGG